MSAQQLSQLLIEVKQPVCQVSVGIGRDDGVVHQRAGAARNSLHHADAAAGQPRIYAEHPSLPHQPYLSTALAVRVYDTLTERTDATAPTGRVAAARQTR